MLLTHMQLYSVNIELEDRPYYHFSEWYFYHLNPQLQLMQLARLCSFAQLFSWQLPRNFIWISSALTHHLKIIDNHALSCIRASFSIRSNPKGTHV